MSTQTKTINVLKKKPKKAKVNMGQGAMRRFLIKLSGAFMIPVSIMAFTGLLLGIGAYLITEGISQGNYTLELSGKFISNIGKPVFQAMPLLFAAAIAIVFTESAGISVFATIIGFVTFSLLQSTFILDASTQAGVKNPEPTFLFDRGSAFKLQHPETIYSEILGIKVLNTGIFGGILVGTISAIMFNIFSDLKLPKIFTFISGGRLVTLLVILLMVPLALLFVVVWPYIGFGIEKLSIVIGDLNQNKNIVRGLPQLITGFTSRVLMPFGLQHIFTQDIIHAVTGPKGAAVVNFTFTQGDYPITLMALPAAALAIICAAPKDNKLMATGVVIPATITAMATGITEPLEFTFLFLAPLVFILFHSVLVGASYMAMAYFLGGNVNVWQSNVNTINNHSPFIGGGLMDIVTWIVKSKPNSNWWMTFAIGGVLTPVYFFGLFGLIKLLNLSTPGRNINPTLLKKSSIVINNISKKKKMALVIETPTKKSEVKKEAAKKVVINPAVNKSEIKKAKKASTKKVKKTSSKNVAVNKPVVKKVVSNKPAAKKPSVKYVTRRAEDKKWCVKNAKALKVTKVFSTQKEAIQYAASLKTTTSIILQSKEGKFIKVSTWYGIKKQKEEKKPITKKVVAKKATPKK